MRETFKSLSIFSAMLMLLLMISTGCDVNIPGCGKRSLPFFKESAPKNALAPTTSTAAVFQANPPVAAPIAPQKKTAAAASVNTKTANGPAPTATPVPVNVEKVAYITIEEGKPTLWTMNPDGTDRTRLTKIGTSSWNPLWSPNGKLLAFWSDSNDGKVNLFMIQKGTSNLVQLTAWDDMVAPSSTSLRPSFSWSPKSDAIVYTYKNQLWVIQTESLEQTSLVTTDSAFKTQSVQWAPHRDNKSIAYTVKEGDDHYSVMLVNPRLKDKLTLYNSTDFIPELSWAADASKVAYIGGNKTIYTSTVEDTTPRAVYASAHPTLAPMLAFSPAEGVYRLLVLAKKDADDSSYCVAVLDPSNKPDQDKGTLKFLTEPGATYAAWSPDGGKIIYTTESGELWTMDAMSGNMKTRVALTGIQNPDWSKK